MAAKLVCRFREGGPFSFTDYLTNEILPYVYVYMYKLREDFIEELRHLQQWRGAARTAWQTTTNGDQVARRPVAARERQQLQRRAPLLNGSTAKYEPECN